MKKLLIILASISGIAAADVNPIYIDANIGYLSAPSSEWNGSMAFNANAGYQFNQYIALEGGVTGSSLNSNSNTSFGGSAPSGSYWAADVAAKGILPLAEAFALYGKAGISYNWYNVSSSFAGFSNDNSLSTAGLLLGIGAQFNLTKQWSLHLEDNYTVLFNSSNSSAGSYTNTSYSNPNVVMFGAQYNF